MLWIEDPSGDTLVAKSINTLTTAAGMGLVDRGSNTQCDINANGRVRACRHLATFDPGTPYIIKV